MKDCLRDRKTKNDSKYDGSGCFKCQKSIFAGKAMLPLKQVIGGVINSGTRYEGEDSAEQVYGNRSPSGDGKGACKNGKNQGCN